MATKIKLGWVIGIIAALLVIGGVVLYPQPKTDGSTSHNV
jgi:hypothetical protein